MTLWSGKIIFTDFSAILGQFLAKSCDFQIPLFWDRAISMGRVLRLNEVFLVLFHLIATRFHEKFSILRFRLSKVIGTRPQILIIFQFSANFQASVRV